MSCQQKYSGVIKGFLMVSLIVVSLMYVGAVSNENQAPKNNVSFEEAVWRLKSGEIDEVRIKNGTAEFFEDEQLSYATYVSDKELDSLFKQINSNNLKVSFAPQASSPLGYLIQILFWLFFISPPIIVVLLLVIIKKMDAKNRDV